MSDDLEQQLYDPSQDDEDINTMDRIKSSNPSNVSISSASTNTIVDNDIHAIMSIDTTIPVDPPVPEINRRRWFLLEPAVFSVFLAMYLAGKSKISLSLSLSLLFFNY